MANEHTDTEPDPNNAFADVNDANGNAGGEVVAGGGDRL
jgi:hypothetical protein